MLTWHYVLIVGAGMMLPKMRFANWGVGMFVCCWGRGAEISSMRAVQETNLVRAFSLSVRALNKITKAPRVPVHRFKFSFELFRVL